MVSVGSPWQNFGPKQTKTTISEIMERADMSADILRGPVPQSYPKLTTFSHGQLGIWSVLGRRGSVYLTLSKDLGPLCTTLGQVLLQF